MRRWQHRSLSQRWHDIEPPHPRSPVAHNLTYAGQVWSDDFGNEYRFLEDQDGEAQSSPA